MLHIYDVKIAPRQNVEVELCSPVAWAWLALLLCAYPTSAMASMIPNASHDVDRQIQQTMHIISTSPTKAGTAFQMDRTSVEIESEQVRIRSNLAEGKAPPLPRHRSRSDKIIGMASTYNPGKSGYREGGAQTASGEAYDPHGWTAAIQIDLRSAFAGVQFGREYQPAFALVSAGKRVAILRINDVGPLRRGRVIDLNERAMRYFGDGSGQGLLPNVEISPLAGESWHTGPLRGTPLDMAGDFPPGDTR